MALAAPRTSNNFKKLQAQLRGSVGKAIADFRHDRRGRSRHGVPVGRQGLLHAARHSVEPAAQRAGELRDHGGQSRSEAAGLPRRGAAAISRGSGGPLPHHRAEHLCRGQAGHSRGQDDVRPVLASAARRLVSFRGRERHHQDRARPSSRRHRRDAVLEHVLRRPAEGDAAEAAQRKSAPHRDSAAGLRDRRPRSPAMPRRASFPSFPAPYAARRPTCSGWW